MACPVVARLEDLPGAVARTGNKAMTASVIWRDGFRRYPWCGTILSGAANNNKKGVEI
jgi:hypothetical protein